MKLLFKCKSRGFYLFLELDGEEISNETMTSLCLMQRNSDPDPYDSYEDKNRSTLVMKIMIIENNKKLEKTVL